LEQFASFAYRANAAQYFNLLWPVCLGFWWTQYGSIGLHRFQGYMLLGSCAVMAAGPIISSARGAALVDLALLFISMATLWLSVIFGSRDHRSAKLRLMVMPLVFVGGAVALALTLGWNHLGLQLRNLEFGLAEREKLYACAERIVADYPLFGTGPGTFEKVFQLYRGSAEGYWPAQLHNDWLETRVTYGWVGSGMIALAMVLVLLSVVERVRCRHACNVDYVFCLSLFGCLVQARFDFPLQVYSIMFLWVVWCSALLGNASSGRRSVVTA